MYFSIQGLMCAPSLWDFFSSIGAVLPRCSSWHLWWLGEIPSLQPLSCSGSCNVNLTAILLTYYRSSSLNLTQNLVTLFSFFLAWNGFSWALIHSDTVWKLSFHVGLLYFTNSAHLTTDKVQLLSLCALCKFCINVLLPCIFCIVYSNCLCCTTLHIT